jgi:nucleoside-diphosphate-sugar epimerase
MGYLSLAKKQYENKLSNQFSTWNFGPNKKNFKTVMEIIQFIKKFHSFEYDIIKKNKYNETKILKLNSLRSKKKLNWSSKWDIYKSLKKTIDWNILYKKGFPARDICEKQILMYINNK